MITADAAGEATGTPDQSSGWTCYRYSRGAGLQKRRPICTGMNALF